MSDSSKKPKRNDIIDYRSNPNPNYPAVDSLFVKLIRNRLNKVIKNVNRVRRQLQQWNMNLENGETIIVEFEDGTHCRYEIDGIYETHYSRKSSRPISSAYRIKGVICKEEKLQEGYPGQIDIPIAEVKFIDESGRVR